MTAAAARSGAAAPAPGAARIAVRNRPLLDVFDLAVRFVAVHAAAYARIAAAVLVPGAALTFALGEGVSWWVGWPFAILTASVAHTPFTIYASRVVFEEGVTVKSVLSASLRSLPGLALARFMQFACIAIGLAFFVVPAAWVGATLLYLGEAFSLERGGAMQAFSRTQRLAGAAFGDAMLGVGLLVTLHAAAALLGDVAGRSALDGLFATTPPEPVWSRGGSLLATLGFWCFVPYAATVKFLLYLNVRTRTEGWDVQTRFAALARRAADDRGGSE